MSNLDEEGTKIYTEYIDAYKKWVKYSETKILYAQSEYLNKTNRKYDRYGYLNLYSSDIDDYITKDKIKETPETKLKYKKLSLLFHPDKFLETDSVFTFIVKSKSDIKILNLIDTLSDNFMDKSKEFIDEIIKKLEDKEFIKHLIEIEDSKKWDSILNDSTCENKDKYTEDYMYNIVSSSAYKYFISGNSSQLDSLYMTYDELKKEIKSTYNKKFLDYYFNLCSHDPEIMSLINDRLRELNNLLKT
jgi:hypothetical protein